MFCFSSTPPRSPSWMWNLCSPNSKKKVWHSQTSHLPCGCGIYLKDLKIKEGKILINLGSFKPQLLIVFSILFFYPHRDRTSAHSSLDTCFFSPFLKIIQHVNIAFLEICFFIVDRCGRKKQPIIRDEAQEEDTAGIWSFSSAYQAAAAFTSVDLLLMMESSLRARRFTTLTRSFTACLRLWAESRLLFWPLALTACRGILATCQSQLRQQVICRQDFELS